MTGAIALPLAEVGFEETALVQIVNILSDHRNVEPTFQFRQCSMTGIGQCPAGSSPTFVVELQHQSWVTLPGFRCGHIFHAVAFPQTARTAKSS